MVGDESRTLLASASQVPAPAKSRARAASSARRINPLSAAASPCRARPLRSSSASASRKLPMAPSPSSPIRSERRSSSPARLYATTRCAVSTRPCMPGGWPRPVPRAASAAVPAAHRLAVAGPGGRAAGPAGPGGHPDSPPVPPATREWQRRHPRRAGLRQRPARPRAAAAQGCVPPGPPAAASSTARPRRHPHRQWSRCPARPPLSGPPPRLPVAAPVRQRRAPASTMATVCSRPGQRPGRCTARATTENASRTSFCTDADRR
ncbi:hypothetical protein G6F68_009657 [Rhizopus microsporus]|nr:hypothetical protein G6F68_009657 [Rhizopus microsporus]